ncbi:hypothetical protein FBR02_12100 [Anaerolineae bacterium CFX9]|nr:hypothetical protein [Anaerolineae bacterium CFX9]
MKRPHLAVKLIVMGAALMLSAACNFFAPEASQQTLSAERFVTATALVSIRSTATLQQDRYSATLEAVSTAIRQVEQQSTRMSATLMALGTPFIDPRFITPVAADGAEAAPPAPVMTSAAGVPVIVGQGGAQGNIPLIPQSPTPTPPTIVENVVATPDPSQPNLINLAMAERVGADDCPVSPSSSFAAGAAGLYATATAVNLTPANIVTARWLRDGVQVVEYTWSPRSNIPRGCIWFYMPVEDAGGILSGNWTVNLDIDGRAVAGPLTFTVGAGEM